MAKVSQFINADASIVTVRTLGIGNVYKRLETTSNSYSSDKILYGIVTDVQHNGETSFIAALEFDPEAYGGGDLTTKTFGNEREANIFSCSVEDWEAAMASASSSFKRNIRTKESELEKAQSVLALLESVSDRATSEPTVYEVTAETAAE